MSAKVLQLLPKKRGRQPQPGIATALSFFPKYGNGHWLYAVGFKGGVTKIGISGNPRARLRQHWKSVDGEVQWMHLFCRGNERFARHVEWIAVDACAAKGRRVNRSEWFEGLSRSDVIAAVRPLIAPARKLVAEWDEQKAKHEAEQAEFQEYLRNKREHAA